MFDPFENRASRDIRNQLALAFFDLLADKDWTNFKQASDRIKNLACHRDHKTYIDDRMVRYQAIFQAAANQPKLNVAKQLWDQSLFFECHEWVEDLWRTQEPGPEKKALQGIIRACGACAFHEAGRTGPCRSAAKKAMDLIQTHSQYLPHPFDAQNLTLALAPLLCKANKETFHEN